MEVKLGLAGFTEIEVRAVVFLNAFESMLMTPAGIVMEVRAVAPLNALEPIVLTLAGSVMEAMEESSNAEPPMSVTPSGITTAPVHQPPSSTTPPLEIV